MAAVTHQLTAIAGSVPIEKARTSAEVLDDAIAQGRLMSAISSVLASLVITIGCVGLYAVMSSDVARRTRTRRQDGARGDEPAHRLDGASAECGDGPAGLANGVPVGIAATHLLASQLYGVPTDVPWTLIAVTVVLTVIATLAALRPARTALRIDPMALLRAD